MVPAGAEVASLPGTGWINHETIANDQPYNGFWVFKRTHEGPYATGFPNNAGINGNRHTISGVELPGRLARSGSLVMHDNPNANWLVSTDDETWYLTDIWQFVDLYGLTFHEFGHAIVFHENLPGFKEYTEAPEDAQSVVEYQGFPVPYGGSGHLVGTAESWDRLSGHSGGYGGVFPPRRWMLTKLVLLVAQETGWKLREIGPFIKAGITTAQLPDAELGEAYSQTLQTNNGGVPVYDWRIVAGALPEGLGLNRFTGEITGSPSAAGQYDFTVELKDDDALSQPVRKELSIQVATEISRIHLPDSATGFGDWAPTINGAVFADGQSIVSGVTNVQDALGFEMLPSADGGGDANGRAFGTDFAAVTVRYGFSTPLDGINGLLLWNYSEDFGGAPFNDRGVRFADVTVTHSGGTTTFPDVEFQQTPNQPGTRSMAQKITFGEILDGVTTLDLGNLRGYGGENQSGASFFLGWGEIAVTEGGSATPFQQWLDGFPTLTGADRHAGADPERDGSPNLIEFVTGGNPTLSDPEKLPRGELAGNHFIFTFIRPDRVLDSGVALTIEVGTTLASWPDVFTVGATTETSSPGITIIQNDAESDTLTLSLPLAGQPNRFARLVAVAD